jgi:hypothetical protein
MSKNLIASSDHSSPINTGVMILKPSEQLYQKGLNLLAKKMFNLQSGWNNTGPPKIAFEKTITHMMNKSKMFRLNTWDFVGANADQGLFTYLFLSSNTYIHPFTTTKHVRHYWSRYKPWISSSCPAYFEFLDDITQTPCTKHLSIYKNKIKKRECKYVYWSIV